MASIRDRFERTLRNCGYRSPLHSGLVDRVVAALEFLSDAGGYGRLLSRVYSCNDEANLSSALLEVCFAWSMERVGKRMRYECPVGGPGGSTVDFARSVRSDLEVHIEMHQQSEPEHIRTSKAKQVAETGTWEFSQLNKGHRAQILRLQSTIRSKVVDSSGLPTKFGAPRKGAVNLVAVDMTELQLGTADTLDCALAAYGDPGVPPEWRLQVFGLFQEDHDSYPEHIRAAAARFSPVKSTVHGVLFLWRGRNESPFPHELQFRVFWNPALVDEDLAKPVFHDLEAAMRVWTRPNSSDQE